MRDYGGAFDVDPHSFWTGEDRDELRSELEDRLESRGIKITGAWIDYNNLIEIEFEHEDASYTVTEQIKMRKIKKPYDLIEIYAPILEEKILKTIE